MAYSEVSALLDELMGRNRNALPNENRKEVHWDDPEICKFYLVNFCPHELFVNTKADLGMCNKLHDDELKKQYEASSSYRKQAYEDEFIRFCQGMLNDVEKRIRKGKQRLSLSDKDDMQSLSPAQQVRNDEKIAMLTEKIMSLVDEAEQLGCQGQVEQAQGLLKLCDKLKEEREQLRRQNESSHWQQTAELAAAQEKQMEVCEVCGAFLIVGDAQQRIDDHLMGKQHMGYARLKLSIEEIMNGRQKAKEEKEKKREDEREERRRRREEEEKKREREREERRKKREEEERRRRHSRSRDRDRRRSRSRSRHRRSRDRDQDRRRPSRGREREKDRKRSRSRERSKSRSSRSSRRSQERHHHHSGRSDRERRRTHSRSRERDRKEKRSKEKTKELEENGNVPEASDTKTVLPAGEEHQAPQDQDQEEEKGLANGILEERSFDC